MKMKSEEDKEGPPPKLAKRPILIATTTDLPELARLGAQLVTAAARAQYVPIQPATAMPGLAPMKETAAQIEARKQATLQRIAINTPEAPEIWKNIKELQDFTQGGIIVRNFKKPNVRLNSLVSNMTRKDAYEFKIPKISSSFHHEIVHFETSQKTKNPLELDSIPSFRTLKHCAVVLETFSKVHKGFTYMKSASGLFDKEAVDTMIRMHYSAIVQREVDEELHWFSYPHEKPFAINNHPAKKSIRKFMNMLYCQPMESVLPDYHMTTEDLASVCCNRSLNSLHIKWVVSVLNTVQNHTMCIYVDGNDEATKKLIEARILENEEKPLALVFIFMIRDDDDDSLSGSHFTLCHIEHCEQKIVYADSLGLAPHTAFLATIREYYSMIFADDIIGFSLNYCHDYRNNVNNVHKCQRGTTCALHYPLHDNIFSSALVVVEVAAIACLAQAFFKHITACDLQSTDSNLYLKDPDVYSGYLRHVLVSWIAEKTINVDHLIPASFPHIDEVENEVSVDAIMLDHGYTDNQTDGAAEADTAVEAVMKSDSPVDEVNNGNENDQAVSDFAELEIAIESESQNESLDLESQSQNEEMDSQSQNESLNESVADSPATDANDGSNQEKIVKFLAESKQKNRKCPYCDFLTHRVYNLKRHISRFHKNEKFREHFEKGNCICTECGFRCKRIREFRVHLVDAHQMIFRSEVIEFANQEEFSKWKNRLEEKDLFYFVKSSGNFPVLGGNVVRYHYCNYSGFYRPRIIDGSRPERKFGSCKMDNICTSELRVIQKKDASITVQVCYTHYNHGKEFRGTWLTLERRRWVDLQLSAGTRDSIYESLRNSVINGRNFETRHIRTAFSVDDIKNDDDDHLSLFSWVYEWGAKLETNPILFYKLKGVTNQTEVLNEDDSVVVVQTENQKKMAVEFGGNGVCCFTAKCSSYFVTTLMVIDESDEGFPMAYCMSNHANENILKIFFAHLVQNLGELKPAWFAYDSNDTFYAFAEMTGHSPRRLMYFNSIERHFRTEVEGINDIMTEVWVYETALRAIKEESVKAFEDLLSLLLQRVTKKSQAFQTSLSHNWLPKKHQWAFCYRPADVDAAVEEFQHWMLQKFSKGRVNQRLDTGIFNLLSYVRMKWIKRKLRLNQNGQLQGENHASEVHQMSLKIPLDRIKTFEDREDKYHITDSDGKDWFTLKLRIGDNKNCKCQLRCSICDICPHSQFCSCPQSLINADMCVHAHVLARYLSNDTRREDTGQSTVEFNDPVANDTEDKAKDDQSKPNPKQAEIVKNSNFVMIASEPIDCSDELSSLRQKMLTSLVVLMEEVKGCKNSQQLKICEKLLDKASESLKNPGCKKSKVSKRKNKAV